MKKQPHAPFFAWLSGCVVPLLAAGLGGFVACFCLLLHLWSSRKGAGRPLTE